MKRIWFDPAFTPDDTSGTEIKIHPPPAGTGGGGIGVPILGGIVQSAVTIPTWTHGNQFHVPLTNTDWPIWVPNNALAVFMSADGAHFLGILPVANSTQPTTGNYGIDVIISDQWYNNFHAGIVIPAGALVYYMTGLNIVEGALAASLVTDTQDLGGTQNIGFVPSIKGVLSSDGSVKIIPGDLDVDFKVSTPAFAGHIPAPAAQAYTVDLAAASTYQIVKIYLKTSAGTCTVALNRNGTAITGASAIAVSSTRTSAVLSQVVAIDDVIELVVSGLSAAADLAYSVRTQPN